jgi:hypothetical protein
MHCTSLKELNPAIRLIHHRIGMQKTVGIAAMLPDKPVSASQKRGECPNIILS